jgi:hypothetical protein
MERKEAERRDWEAREAARREAARRESDRIETARREAERREWDRREAERRVIDKRSSAQSIQATYSPTTALGLVTIVLLVVIGVLVRRDLPVGAKVFLALAGPIIGGAIHYLIGIKDEVTLAEMTLLTFPFLGALVIALMWKLQA